jgi:hypothetical protein
VARHELGERGSKGGLDDRPGSGRFGRTQDATARRGTRVTPEGTSFDWAPDGALS